MVHPSSEHSVTVLTAEEQQLESELRALASLMDDRFNIPGTNIRFGLDALIGLIPGIGDAVTSAVTLYLISRAWSFGVPFAIKVQMIWNLLLDLVIGAIPFIGDFFDVAWRANRKNVKLLQRYLDCR